MRKRKQISLMDGYSLKEKILNAAKTATKYITSINSDTGIRVHAADDTQNYTQVDADGMKVYKDGSEVASFGSTARVGPTNSGNALLDANGMKVYKNGSEVASFGSEARIGTAGGSNVLAGPDGVSIRDGSTELSSFNADGIRLGKETAQNVQITPASFEFRDADGGLPVSINVNETPTTVTAKWLSISPKNYNTYRQVILRGVVENDRYYLAVGTTEPSEATTYYIENIGPSAKYLTIDGVRIGLYKMTDNVVTALLQNTTSIDKYVLIQFVETYRESTTIINQRKMKIGYETLSIESSTGTAEHSYCKTYGNVAQIHLDVYKGGSVSNGGIVFRGKLLNCIPEDNVSLVGIFSTQDGTYIITGYISLSGEIYVFNTSGRTLTIDSSHTVGMYATYIIKEGS